MSAPASQDQAGLVRNFYRRYLKHTWVGAAVRRVLPGGGVRATLSLYWAHLQLSRAGTWLGRPRRLRRALRHLNARWKHLPRWLFVSREASNYTYELTPQNERHLALLLAFVLERDVKELAAFISELRANTELRDYLSSRIRASRYRYSSDETVRFGRRAGWYAAIRALKPAVVVETGVDKGLGAAACCEALRKNAEQGLPGRYIGIDIDPGAGWMLGDRFAGIAELRFGDAAEQFRSMREQVDFYINDADHREEFELREYHCAAPRLSKRGVIFGDNAHVTNALADFSDATGRRFVFFREDPEQHWYQGAGIGISVPGKSA